MCLVLGKIFGYLCVQVSREFRTLSGNVVIYTGHLINGAAEKRAVTKQFKRCIYKIRMFELIIVVFIIARICAAPY
jgi:hypothetical protein